MENKLQLAATVENITTRSDKTLKITLSTQELPPEQSALLLGLHQKYGWILFSLQEFTESDIPIGKLPDKHSKSQGQRIRSCLRIIWEKNTDKSQDFDDYYRQRTEEIINKLKEEM